ncbi:MAG: VOC family protein [Rhodospirillaceae bacterium]|jgi:predicted enzyme related to lactoylglutathione lyase|nr:VOC family protein [Rhodospirillaceae bacterium]MBT5456998.1 VOC family protein [Rhodospirillaceae bacterium]
MTSDSNSTVTLGHLRLPVTDLKGAVGFFEAMGAHQDVDRDGFAVVEFADRTRLQLTETKEAIKGDGLLQFDFRVEDIDATWKEFSDKGLKPSDIARRNPGHDSFLLNGPDGFEVKVNSGFKRG